MQCVLAAGLLKKTKSLSEPREKGNHKGNPCQPTVEWNGFAIQSGIGKSSPKAAKKSAYMPRAPIPTAETVDKACCIPSRC